MPEFLCPLVLGLFEEPLEFATAPTLDSVFCGSVVSLTETVVGSGIGRGRNIPGNRTSFFGGSIKPLFTCCSFNTDSNFSLLNFSESDSTRLSSPSSLASLEL